MNIKTLISFSIGFISGSITIGLGAGLYFKKKYEVISDKQISEMESYYKRTDGYKKEENKEEDQNKEDEGLVVSYQEIDKKEVKKRIHEKTEPVDYTSYYDPAESEHPEDEDNEYMRWHKKNKERPPKIISEEDAGALPPFVEHQTLFYYPANDVLTTEEDMVEDNPELLVGNCLEKYGFKNSNEEFLFVMNYEYDCVYEIQKFIGEYYEE